MGAVVALEEPLLVEGHLAHAALEGLAERRDFLALSCRRRDLDWYVKIKDV